MILNKKNLIITALIFILLIFLPFTNAITIKENSKKTDELSILNKIQKSIQEKNGEWIADVTPISEYSPEQIENIINVVPDKKDENYNENPSENTEVPEVFDWRNVNGIDWTTPIQNQGECGACVSFAYIAALESVIQISSNNNFNCNLSEAQLFFCTGGDCDFGIFPWDALEYLQLNGVTDESCFPYRDRDMNCNQKCSDWEIRAVKVNGSGTVSYADIKEALIKYGPLFTSFTVFQDFLYYKEGIYEPMWGATLGNHCVSIIGYNDSGEYWICKNSWGKNWGENGYFNIKYRKCDLDKDARYLTVYGSNPPEKPTKPIGPQNGQAGTKYYFQTQSIDPEDNGIYYIFDWGDNTTEYEKFHPRKSGEIINVSHVWSVKNQDQFSIRVKAVDVYGYESSWSDETIINIKNNIPEIPLKPSGPNRIRPREETSYSTFINDSNGDEIYLLWDWGDDSEQEWIGPFESKNTISANHSWNSRTKYEIKVKAKDEHGAETDWSEPLTIWASKSKYNTNNYFPLINKIIELIGFFKINTLP